MEGGQMRQHFVAKAIIGGLLGTLLQMIAVYGVSSIMTGDAMHVAILLERSCTPDMLAHLLSGGVIFPLGYIWLSSRVFSGPPALQGMLWAGLIWFSAEVIMAPTSLVRLWAASRLRYARCSGISFMVPPWVELSA